MTLFVLILVLIVLAAAIIRAQKHLNKDLSIAAKESFLEGNDTPAQDQLTVPTKPSKPKKARTKKTKKRKPKK